MRVNIIVIFLLLNMLFFYYSGLVSANDHYSNLPVINATYLGKSASSKPFGDYPNFIVGITSETFDGERSYCTGVALTDSIVLTAGHCLTESVEIELEIVSDNLTSETVRTGAEDWSYHPMHNGGYKGPSYREFNSGTAEKFVDLGLISLGSPSKYLKPITIIPIGFNLMQPDPPWLFVLGAQRDEWFRATGRFSLSQLSKLEQISRTQYTSVLKGSEGWCVRDSGGPVTVAAEDEEALRHYLVGISFAFFDPIPIENTKELEGIWGSIDKVPQCGRRFGYLDVRSQIGWIRETANELLPGEGAKIDQFVEE